MLSSRCSTSWIECQDSPRIRLSTPISRQPYRASRFPRMKQFQAPPIDFWMIGGNFRWRIGSSARRSTPTLTPPPRLKRCAMQWSGMSVTRLPRPRRASPFHHFPPILIFLRGLKATFLNATSKPPEVPGATSHLRDSLRVDFPSLGRRLKGRCPRDGSWRTTPTGRFTITTNTGKLLGSDQRPQSSPRKRKRTHRFCKRLSTTSPENNKGSKLPPLRGFPHLLPRHRPTLRRYSYRIPRSRSGAS